MLLITAPNAIDTNAHPAATWFPTEKFSVYKVRLPSTAPRPLVFASQMILEKTQPDEWLSSPSLQIKSSFSVPVFKDVGQYILKSEPFGLGWIAQCSINVDTIGGKRIPLQSRAAFNFYILPSSSKLASLGDLSFRASSGSNFNKTETVKVIESLTTEAFLMRVNLAGSDLINKSNLSLSLEVTFPFRQNPALTSWARVSKVITSTLQCDGKLPIDLKFIICTRVSPRGHIGYPKAIFASSALLKGYTPFVDKCTQTVIVKGRILILPAVRH